MTNNRTFRNEGRSPRKKGRGGGKEHKNELEGQNKKRQGDAVTEEGREGD